MFSAADGGKLAAPRIALRMAVGVHTYIAVRRGGECM